MIKILNVVLRWDYKIMCIIYIYYINESINNVIIVLVWEIVEMFV